MRSPVLAITWQLWSPHRWALAATVILLLSMALLLQLQPFDPLEAQDLKFHPALFSVLFAFELAVVAGGVSFGAEMPLEASASGYPSWMFTLPVSTHTLAFWPMLQGVVVIAGLGEAWTQFVLRPAGFAVPPGLAAALLAAIVAALQALLWMPFPLPWLRLIVAVLLMPLLFTLPLFWNAFELDQTVLMGVLVGLIPVAYGVAFVGVSLARCSADAQWRWLPRRASGALECAAQAFSSPAQAQFWLEWRLHGKSVFLTMGAFLLYPVVLLLFLLDPVRIGGEICRGMFYLPLLEAFLVGHGLGKVSPWWKGQRGVASFIAARPLSSTAVVAAKFKVAGLRTLIAWGMILVLLAFVLVYLSQYREIPNWGDLLLQRFSALEGVALLALLVGFTWILLIQNFCIPLSGRKWIGYLSAAGYFLLLMVLLTLGGHPEYSDLYLALLPWVAGGLIVLKLFLAAWIFRTLYRRGLASPRTLALGTGLWLGGVLLLFAFLVWFIPTERISLFWLAFAAILLLPLARPAAAPLALEWNRHR
jgi:hypothetical protein